MARIDQFSGLSAFLAVSERANFRLAAADLGVTRAAVSQAIQSLERRLGQSLFQRTTRGVALTEAGKQLLSTVGPASSQIRQAVEQLAGQGGRPIGHLRLTVPRIAMDLAVTPIVIKLRQTYPDITVDLDVNDAAVDLMAGCYDAGIRVGEFIEKDMVAVKLTPDFQWTVVGSPDYFARRGRPNEPRDLLQHECIRYRFPAAATIYRWEFSVNGADFSLEPFGGMTVNDHLSMIDFAQRGLGLAYTADLVIQGLLQTGELQPVLQGFLPSKQGLFLYFPVHVAQPPKLRALIEIARVIYSAQK